ncbi:heavy-metal-associated domain-containing protein [Polaromonas naphthalenivorans]|uniref:Heavy metal transport/detoxification protein n=1 Tax=Polaromonas naphthalenivorans (strain CJ2) TaxID=365044 RepID=A1VVW5_POLNA|nr:heavy metal-associated domain-containing protein [Polaromonas naphthalenivorans]ABM39793.1 Heavy metal transport/detoxification protein [Polaromonas naphthalenivorans CJ2]
MNTIDLQVEGMSCGSCVKHVTQALQSLPGVGGVEVDLASGRVRVSGELAPGGDSLMTALTAAGYPAKLATDALTSSPASPPKASGCHSGSTGGCGCR